MTADEVAQLLINTETRVRAEEQARQSAAAVYDPLTPKAEIERLAMNIMEWGRKAEQVPGLVAALKAIIASENGFYRVAMPSALRDAAREAIAKAEGQ